MNESAIIKHNGRRLIGRTEPMASIIIPTYDRPEALKVCLSSIAQLNFERDSFEVIVVDDGSPIAPDDLTHLLPGLLEVRILKQKNRGPAAARNAGAQLARGQMLAFTDDDCRPDPEWLRALSLQFQAAPDRLIGGRTLNALDRNIYATASQLVIDYVYCHYNSDPNRAGFFATNNMAVSRQGFIALGGFDPRFRTAEDREFCDRWRQAGRSMLFAPDAVVRHAHDLTLSGYLRQHFRYGQGAFHYHQIRAHRGSGRLANEFVFYRSLARRLFTSLSGYRPARACGLLALLLLWQATNAIGYAWELVRAAAKSATSPKRAAPISSAESASRRLRQ